MAPWTFDVKFPLDTQFAFGSLTFAVREDGDLRMLPLGLAPQHRTLADGQAPWSLTTSSTSGGACSGLDPFVGLYICTIKIVRGIPVVMYTFQPLAGASSSSSSATSPDQDSSDDYPEIRVSVCGDSAREGRLIFMVTQMGIRRTTAPEDIPPLGDQKCSTLKRSMMA
jgi:hypothetical protein